MKHLYTFLFLVCILNTQAQDTTPPETINDLQVIHELHDDYQDGGVTSFFDFSWTIPYEESSIVSYKIYNYDQYFAEFTCDNCDFYSLLILELNTDFCLKIAAVDDSGNEALLSNEVCLNSNYYYKEFFISQYYEDGNNNKAIELSINSHSINEVINLSEYDLRINTNGGASWSSPLPLSGNFSQDEMYSNSYVIINSNATNVNLINDADLSTNSEVLQFDGNDPVGLFKNGQLVDIIGNFNGGNNYFAQNVNLQRRPCNVHRASATPSPVSYIPSDWIDGNFADCQNTFVNPIGIGVYSQCCLLSTEDITIGTFKIHPNPVIYSELRITHTTPINISNIELYNINGKHIESFKMNYTNNQFLLNLPHLSKGVYFLKIYSDNKSVTKKLIKQ